MDLKHAFLSEAFMGSIMTSFIFVTELPGWRSQAPQEKHTELRDKAYQVSVRLAHELI